MLKRHENQNIFQASIHGIEIKSTLPEEFEPVELTQEQEELMREASKKAFERKAKKLGR